MTATCARPGCGKPLANPTRGPRPTYCSDRCRKAAARRPAATDPGVVSMPTPVRGFAPGASERRGGGRQLCPVDPAHGPVLDWPTSRWGFHCPHVDHDGRPATSPFGDLAPSRAFFTTDEVLTGALRAEVDTTVAMRPDARPSRGAHRVAGSTLDPPVVATFPPNDVAVIPPATHRAPERVPGPGGPSSDPVPLVDPGASSSARPGLRRRSDPRQFWLNVDTSGGLLACWLWTGTRARSGYGRIPVGHRGRRTSAPAHRVSWALAFGPVPEGAWVLHRCDNPPCVNPAHLFLGSHADNMADMARKGRGRSGQGRGESNSAHKLTAAAVAEIKRRLASGEPRAALVGPFGVSPRTIDLIATGRTWSHIPTP